MSPNRILPLILAILVLGAWIADDASAQGVVGFLPVPGQTFTGPSLSVTPVVSADRRYVRLSLSATFNEVIRFDNFPVPAAVGGGPGGPGGLGGLGGLGGAGGGIGGAGAGINGQIQLPIVRQFGVQSTVITPTAGPGIPLAGNANSQRFQARRPGLINNVGRVQNNGQLIARAQLIPTGNQDPFVAPRQPATLPRVGQPIRPDRANGPINPVPAHGRRRADLVRRPAPNARGFVRPTTRSQADGLHALQNAVRRAAGGRRP